MTFVNEVYQRADAFPFSRRIYELFADYWGVREARDIGPQPRSGTASTVRRFGMPPADPQPTS